MTDLLKTGPRHTDAGVRDAMSDCVDELVTMPERRRRAIARVVGRCAVGLSRDARSADKDGRDLRMVIDRWEDILREVADTIACPRGVGR